MGNGDVCEFCDLILRICHKGNVNDEGMELKQVVVVVTWVETLRDGENV